MPLTLSRASDAEVLSNAAPFPSLCAIESYRDDDSVNPRAKGTGWVFDRRTIVTAGHVVAGREFGAAALAKRVQIKIRQHANVLPLAVLDATGIEPHPTFTSSTDPPAVFDIARLTFDTDLPPSATSLDPLTFSEVGDIAGEFRIVGYPLTIPDPSAPAPDGKVLFIASAASVKIANVAISYDAITRRGLSGAPVLSSDSLRVAGIHLNGSQSATGGPVGLAMSEAVVDWLRGNVPMV